MDNKISNIDELRAIWTEVNSRLDRLEPSMVVESRKVADRNILSARRRIMRRDKRIIFLCAVCMFIFPVYFAFYPGEMGYEGLNVGYFRPILVAEFLLFFLFALCMMMYHYLLAQEINPVAMSIEEVARRARQLKRLHLRYECVAMVMALLLLGTFFWMLSYGDTGLVCAAVFGGIVGLSIGLPMFFRYLSDYRRMIYPYEDQD